MSRKSGSKLKRLFFLAVLLGLVYVGVSAFRSGPAATIAIEQGLPAIGKSTPLTVQIDEPGRGLGTLKVELVQGERSETLLEEEHIQLPPWKFWGPRVEQKRFELTVGRQHQDWLKEGSASLRVTAGRAPAWISRPDPAVEELELPVRLRPPTLSISSRHIYAAQGGCEVVVYQVGDSSVEDGVRAGDWVFPGFPLPGGNPGQRFALFSVPYDHQDATQVKLYARDDVNNESQMNFVDQFFSRPLTTDTIPINDRFMSRVVPAILSQSPELTDQGNLLDNYLNINRNLRAQNAETLIALSRESEPSFLWDDAFLRMRNAKRTSSFADRRSYVYNGSVVDHQDHLGFDLASVKQAEIQAANDGVVVMSRYFGIYGNTVVIDHGYGLHSLYGHLSSLSVAEGDTVERGQQIGRSGVTGLSGGDHLHFTMLLHGLPVNPQEWWDPNWLHDRLKLKLGEALPYKG